MTTATAVGYIEMRIAKVVGLGAAEDEPSYYIVLEELSGDRRLAIAIGHAEAFSLAARLGGIEWRRPMTYQFAAGLVQALGGQVRQVRIDRVAEETYIATVEVDGPGWRPAGRRTAQRRAQPGGAGPGADLGRPRGAARGRGQARG
jgi:bifunctional DNase/RNase